MESVQGALQSRALMSPTQAARFERLKAEVGHAVSLLDANDRNAWLRASGGYFVRGVGHRVSSIGGLIKAVGTGLKHVAGEASQQAREGNLTPYLKEKTNSAYTGLARTASELGTSSKQLYAQVRANPKQMAPELVTMIVTSLLVSGGPDGNGGAPDLDLVWGIDAHRSVFTHSILMGSAIEAAILSVLHLVRLIHHKLPAKHDPWWDSAMRLSTRVGDATVLGSNIGMAYHLFVDGLVQPGAYHGLPVPLPMEAHQALMTGSAILEAGEIVRKSRPAPVSARSAESIPSEERANSTALLPAPASVASAKRSELAPIERLQDEPVLRLAERSAEANWRSEHRVYLQKSFPVPPRIVGGLTTEQLAIVRKFGQWLLALEEGRLEAHTADQRRFVAMARGQLEPGSELEAAWRAYREAQGRLGLG